MVHSVLYPGLDYQYCDRCKQWIVTQTQLDSLTRQLSQDKSKKTMDTIVLQITLEKNKMNRCIDN